MKQNKLPTKRLDIITPVFDETMRLTKQAESYPEMAEIIQHEQGSKQTITLYPITPKTALFVRKATEIIAYYFRREMGYDFPPYQALEDENPKDRIFLLVQKKDWDTRYAVGAIVLRWRIYADAPEELVLSWIWIHPFLRRHGILAFYWEIFRKLYGDFSVEPPLSKAMKSFLTKVHVLLPDEDLNEEDRAL